MPNATHGERGLLGDRAYAVADSADGKAATAKNPRKWPTLFGFRATFIEPPRPPVRVCRRRSASRYRMAPPLRVSGRISTSSFRRLSIAR